MAGLGVKIFTDEMITPKLAEALQQAGYDVMSCQAAGRHNQAISDEDQLTYATSDGRAIYTFNASDYDVLDRDWHADGGWHAGIIISEDLNQRFSEMLQRIQRHLDTVTLRFQHDRLLLLR